MKKILIITSLFIVFHFSGFTQEKENNESRIPTTFQTDFPGASEISWQEGVEFNKVSFSYKGTVMLAYYNPGGELIAASRNISSFQLPLRLLTSLKTNFDRYWITDLFELSVSDNTEYYVTLENATEKKILIATGSDWELYDTTSKED